MVDEVVVEFSNGESLLATPDQQQYDENNNEAESLRCSECAHGYGHNLEGEEGDTMERSSQHR